MKIFTKSDRYMLEQPKIIIISKFYQTHAKISKPTGATAPVEKVKEISSIDHVDWYGQNQAITS